MQPAGKAIAGAFVKAQAAFGPALKTNTNPHFRSKYAGLDACVEAVIDALHANGIALIQRTLPCESGVTVETLLVHSSGETLSGGTLHLPASKADPQGYGSALTYARRYALAAMLGVTQEDDDGQAASGPRPTPAPMRQPSPSPLASKRQLDMLWATAKEVYGAEAEGELRKLIEGAGLNSSKELTTTQASDMIAALQAYKADAS